MLSHTTPALTLAVFNKRQLNDLFNSMPVHILGKLLQL